MFVQLKIESWGTTSQDEKANSDVAKANQSKTDATFAGKRLCPKDALKGVKAAAEEARKYLRSVTHPWGDGARIIDAGMLMPMKDDLRQTYKPAWQKEVRLVVGQLPYYRDTWGPANLGKLYQAKLYPDETKLEAQFIWELKELPLDPDSKDIRHILGNDYVEEICRRNERDVLIELTNRIAGPIQNMVRRLAVKDGKFFDTLVSNVEDIAKLIPALNLVGDSRFVALQRDIEEKLTKLTAKELRQSETARADTAAAAQGILDRLSSFLPGAVVAPVAISAPTPPPAPKPLPLLQIVPPPAPVAPKPAPTPAPATVVPPAWRKRVLHSLAA